MDWAVGHVGRRVAPLCCVLALIGAGCAFGPSPTPTATPRPPRVAVVSATTPIDKVNAPSGSPLFYGIAASDDAVWVYETPLGVALRVNPATNTVVAQIPVDKADYGQVALGDGAVWVAVSTDSPMSAKLYHIDPRTNTVAGVVDFPSETINGLAVTPGAVWVTHFTADSISVIDPGSNQITATLRTYAGPFGATYGAGAVWVCNELGDQFGLTRWDPRTRQAVAQIDVGAAQGLSCGGVVATASAVWLVLGNDANNRANEIERVDPATNRIVTVVTTPSSQTFEIAADEHTVWLWFPSLGLTRVDAGTNTYLGEFSSPGVAGVAIGAGAVWVANPQLGQLLRLSPSA